MGRLAHKAWRGYTALNNGFFTLGHFETGSVVKIDLVGEQCDGVVVSPNSRTTGILTDARRNILQLKHTDCPHLQKQVGEEIGLGVMANLGTPGGEVNVTLRCIKKNGPAAYYLPEEVNGRFDCPSESQYSPLFATYGRMVVNGAVLFDQKDNSFLF